MSVGKGRVTVGLRVVVVGAATRHGFSERRNEAYTQKMTGAAVTAAAVVVAGFVFFAFFGTELEGDGPRWGGSGVGGW